ncbi:MAG: hypothetical protein EU551_02265 [Promethearchaeota archaeon]|nr:MAG: hypothetical protein EU551_02265 [Candidatus Lokiarchaeota archaeon]
MSKRPRFRPFSSEKEIPKTNCTVQIGDVSGRWAVVVREKLPDGNKKAIALKRIKKLTDTQIINVIKDTIGKKYSLDTFTLGSTMSGLLKEVYAKIKGEKPEKQAAPVKPVPQSTPQPAPDKPAGVTDLPKKRSPDSFWSSYDSAASSPTQPIQPEQPEQPAQLIQPTQPIQPQQIEEPAYTEFKVQQMPQYPPAQEIEPDDSGELDDILGDLGLKCPFCGNDIEPEDEICPSCGRETPL